ncbi:MAG: hypothetical protein U0528_17180 [Anaerolineae bacterium]
MLFLTVNAPKFTMPPPPCVAELPEKVLLAIVKSEVVNITATSICGIVGNRAGDDRCGLNVPL